MQSYGVTYENDLNNIQCDECSEAEIDMVYIRVQRNDSQNSHNKTKKSS